MASIYSNQWLDAPRLPVYLSPLSSSSNSKTPVRELCDQSSSFEEQAHSCIINLQQKREQLSHKIALAQQEQPSAAYKHELVQEYAALERSSKLLNLYAQALEKSRQSVAANLR